MERAELEEHLAENERHLAESARRIAEVAARIARLAEDGGDTGEAERLLVTLHETRRLHEQGRTLVQKQLEEIDRGKWNQQEAPQPGKAPRLPDPM